MVPRRVYIAPRNQEFDSEPVAFHFLGYPALGFTPNPLLGVTGFMQKQKRTCKTREIVGGGVILLIAKSL